MIVNRLQILPRMLTRGEAVHPQDVIGLIIRGVAVFPSQVESVLATVPGLTMNCLLVVE